MTSASKSDRGRVRAFLHSAVCRLFGHSWGYYRYPHGDGWFSGPHERRYCSGCYADEAYYADEVSK